MLPCIEVETAPNPNTAVIWLHGLGADGNDFAPIIPQLNLQKSPGIRFVFPSAPAMPVTINGGHVMPAWYDILGRDVTDSEDANGISLSARSITQLIDREVSRGIAYDKIVLAGFSQGCAMALYIGLRCPHKLAGIIAMSGYLPLANTLTLDKFTENKDTPILMAHGLWDPVVIPERGAASFKFLKDLGYRVEWKTYPMEHSVHPIELADISNFLKKVLFK